MERQLLIGLQAPSYEHPFDRSALASLKGTPGLELVIRKFNEYGFERFLRIQYTGSHLRITRDNFPEIRDMLREAATILNLHHLPDLYVMGGGSINAFTAGVERPILVLHAGCIDHLSADELFFVIGHELGHIKSGHVLYHQMGAVLPLVGDFVSRLTLGTGGLVSTALEAALHNWQRMSELTADRAGLLACQNRDAAISAMVKIAGLPHKFYGRFNADDFIAQAREFKAFDENLMDKIAKFISILGHSHPWTVLRAAEFDNWMSSGEYNRILDACGSRVADSENAPRFCSECGAQLMGDETFCPQCGSKVPPQAFTTF
ncbi:MAG TPA: M48 family metallopeptidase [Thermoanaerobaculia bacterium]|nr:M48 family metallopeptidase [Thermoanaerobaculia bacterium]